MVKIGNFVLFERRKKEVSERYKGSVSSKYGGKPKRKTFHPGEMSWRARYHHFEKLSLDYPLFNQSCVALAGMVMSQGAFYKPAVNKSDDTYALAEEAMWRVKKMSRDQRVNVKFHETVNHLAKYGSCFWEASFEPTFEFRLAPSQGDIEPYKTDAIGNVTHWRQISLGTEVARWSVNPDGEEAYIIPIHWNVTSTSWPYGNSLGTGSETELEALIEMETNAKDYMEKQAWPYEVLQLGDGKQGNASVLDSDYQSAKTEWRNRQPGEGIATRNMPVAIVPGGTGSSPIRELAVLCQLMKDNAHDGLMVAPLSKLYNSTEASAKVMEKHIMSVLGQPMQWVLKEAYEEVILKPFLERAQFSRKSCPEVVFESPDAHKAEEGEYWALLVERQIQTPKQAAEHLGLEYDEEYWTREEEKLLQQATQQQMNQQQQEQGGNEDVWEVRKKRT